MSLAHHRDFRKLWIGQTVSELGSHITREGLPLTAVLVLHAGPAQMGLLAGTGALAVVVTGLLVGVWVDRLRRRPLMIAADLARAAVLAWIPLAALLRLLSMPHLYLVAALAGMLTVLFDTACQSYVPVLVERSRVLEANSKLGLSTAVTEVAGPGLTGFLVQLITAPVAILFDAVSFLVSAVLLLLIRAKAEPCGTERGPAGEEIREGLRAVLHHPLLRPLAARAATFSLFVGFQASLYILYAVRTLGLSPAVIGLIIAVGGAGNLLGALLAGRLARRFGLGPTLIAAALLTGLAAMLVPLARGTAATAVAFLVAAQCGDVAYSVYDINELSLRQRITPDRLLGRVNSVMILLFRGVYPLGALIGGVLAGAIGIRTTMLISAAGVLLSPLWLIFSPVRRQGPKESV
jgi:predicted MFS family arabinose efflux permease